MNRVDPPGPAPRARFEWKAYVAGLLPGVVVGLILRGVVPLTAVSGIGRIAILVLAFAAGLCVQFVPLWDSPRVKFALAMFVVAAAIFWVKP